MAIFEDLLFVSGETLRSRFFPECSGYAPHDGITHEVDAALLWSFRSS
jgi:hypothetical protein